MPTKGIVAMLDKCDYTNYAFCHPSELESHKVYNAKFMQLVIEMQTRAFGSESIKKIMLIGNPHKSIVVINGESRVSIFRNENLVYVLPKEGRAVDIPNTDVFYDLNVDTETNESYFNQPLEDIYKTVGLHPMFVLETNRFKGLYFAQKYMGACLYSDESYRVFTNYNNAALFLSKAIEEGYCQKDTFTVTHKEASNA